MEAKVKEYEMLKALYDFKATFAKTLSFRENDLFILYHEHTKQRNWWQVINEMGQVGYVPSNYVASVKVNSERMAEFLDSCLVALREEMIRHDGNLPAERENLMKFLSHKQSQQFPSLKTKSEEERMRQQDEPRRVVSTPEFSSNSKLDTADSQAAYQLVDQVRRHTQLSHELSRVAVSVVVSGLRDVFPKQCIPQFDSVLALVQGPLTAPKAMLNDTHDSRRLRHIFTELTTCKEDSQQRSWTLHEDEPTICEYLQELNSILANADNAISKLVIEAHDYDHVSTLVQYYQMETRWSIRQLLLQAFGLMCSLDAAVVTLILNSVLPCELARDMRSNSRKVSRLSRSALLLTMIFSMGEPMPIPHREHLGVDFAAFLFDIIENPPDTDVEEQLPDMFLNLILSYNLQFISIEDNLMIQALLQRSIAKTFTEKILLLLNREEDPVRIFDHVPAPPHSVLKLFIDLFTNQSTASLFYTNDVKVLIDIIVRQLADLSPGDNRRQQYLELCRHVMRNSEYSEHHHRQDDILKCFTRIFCEESHLSKRDQHLVKEISNEFPQYFKL